MQLLHIHRRYIVFSSHGSSIFRTHLDHVHSILFCYSLKTSSVNMVVSIQTFRNKFFFTSNHFSLHQLPFFLVERSFVCLFPCINKAFAYMPIHILKQTLLLIFQFIFSFEEPLCHTTYFLPELRYYY